MNQKKKAVVTGGAGFIGSHLVEKLVGKGYAVTLLDDLSTGKLDNIQNLIDSGSVEFVRGSIADLSLLQDICEEAMYIFHLAAFPSVPRSVENPLECHRINATGTLNVLIAGRDNKVGKVICASSSSVYGDTPTLPKDEGMFPQPLSPYAVAKLTGEYYCQAFNSVYDLSTVSLRFFNVYGPRQDPNSQYAAAIPKFIRAAFDNSPPVIYGDGEQTRDFTFVNDTIAAIILAAESNALGVYNIAGGNRITINDLAALIIRLVGSNVQPVYQEARPGDVKHSQADISRAGTFGYKPEYNLEEGLHETIRWLDDRKT
jgi:UDP-glucose 4-epimerase